MSIETMKQALEALEEIHAGNMTPMAEEAWNKAITSLRQAIAEAEKQEPYGYLKLSNGKFYVEVVGVPDLDCNPDYLPLHTHPQPKREWVGLTHSDIDQGLLRSDYALKTAEAWRAGVVFAMTKLKEKNT